jgi:hypothetical protein
MKKYLIPISIGVGLIAALAIWKFQSHNENCEHHNHDTVVMSDTTNQRLLEEVMAVHDEVMPKMSRIAELQKKMSDMAASTKDKTQKNKYLDLATRLEKADEAMMVWMEKFPEGEVLDKLPAAELNKVLSEEKTKVINMKTEVFASLQAVEDLILQEKK